MKKSTYRILKVSGMVLFLLMFGVFIYVLSKALTSAQAGMTYLPEPALQNSDPQILAVSEGKPIGFDYQRNTGDEG